MINFIVFLVTYTYTTWQVYICVYAAVQLLIEQNTEIELKNITHIHVEKIYMNYKRMC